MRPVRLIIFCAALLAAAIASQADTIFFVNGSTATGKIVKIDTDKVTIRVKDKGNVEFEKAVVNKILIAVSQPAGKVAAKQINFSTKPEDMPFQTQTAHYRIMTDTSESACTNTGAAMEALFQAFTATFKPKNTPRTETQIIIWNNRQPMIDYLKAKSLKTDDNLAGMFMADGNGMFIFVYRRTDEFNTLSTLYHEGTHQFIRMAFGNKIQPPLWVNEGLAVYFENSSWDKGKLKTGIIPKTRLLDVQKHLRANTYIRLSELFERKADNFDALCYGEAWSFIYFTANANDGIYAKRFNAYFQMLRDGKDHDKAFQEAFPAGVEKIEEAWKQYVLELKIPDDPQKKPPEKKPVEKKPAEKTPAPESKPPEKK